MALWEWFKENSGKLGVGAVFAAITIYMIMNLKESADQDRAFYHVEMRDFRQQLHELEKSNIELRRSVESSKEEVKDMSRAMWALKGEVQRLNRSNGSTDKPPEE
jgi:uncharacterized protein YlxW (UPF0749 family)